MTNEPTPVSNPTAKEGNSPPQSETKAKVSSPPTFFGIKIKLLLAFFTLAGLTAVASAVAWYVFVNIDHSVTRITAKSVPGMVASLRLAEKSAEIAATAPAIMASDHQEERALENLKLETRASELAAQIKGLHSAGVPPKRVAALLQIQSQITARLRELNAAVEKRIEFRTRMEKSLASLSRAHAKFLETLEPLVDDTAFDLVMAGEKLGEKGSPSTSNLIEGGVSRLDILLTVRGEGNLVAGLLNEAAGVPDDTLLQPLRERFIAATGHIKKLLTKNPHSLNDLSVQNASKALIDFGRANDSIFELRRQELRYMASAHAALEASRSLSVQLGDEVSKLVVAAQRDSDAAALRSAEAIQSGNLLMILITAASILGAALIMMQYVRPRIVRPLENITEAMAALAAGDTTVDIPGRERSDEMGRMAQALGVFRDTAIEVQESNLREIRETRRRLSDAIETISEGFSLYDSEDRLVVFNSKYCSLLYPEMPDEILPGMTFESIIRRAAERGLIRDAEGRMEEWLEKRLARHRDPSGTHTQRRGDGRWIMVSERKTEDGGTVAVYSDITELKQREEELAEKSNAMEMLSNQLAKYLSPQVYASIFSGKSEAKVASHRKKLTVFFSDIAGFTETVDRMESEDLTQLLNHYLTEMSQIALAHGATIDKYVGDAIVIFFGDPETRGVKEDALACVEMANAMRKKMHELEGEWRAAGIEKPLQCRIGINTGYCTVGNFGSEDRMDYTIIGGGVNLASRLEGQAEPGEILISYETYALVQDRFFCEERGHIHVKGIAYPVAVYQVIDSYENLGQKPEPIREDQPHLKLDLNPEAMSADEMNQAADALRRALNQLAVTDKRNTSDPPQEKDLSQTG